MELSLENLVKKIHDSKYKVVMAITGGGTEAVGELCKYGGASNTLIEATVCYNQTSFDSYVGGKPDKYASVDAAAQLATSSFLRVIHQHGVSDEEAIGLGATMSLGKAEPEREGRKHQVYMAYVHKNILYTKELEIQPLGLTRKQEEEFAARLVIKLLAMACQVIDKEEIKESYGEEYTVDLGTLYSCGWEAYKIYTGQKKWDLSLAEKTTGLIFPGSFNPIHDGHKNIIQKVNEKTGTLIDLEVSIKNVEKPILSYKGFCDRINEVTKAKNEGVPINGLILTCAPKFIEKTKDLLKKKCEDPRDLDDYELPSFIMGADTLQRIHDSKYYNSYDEMMSVVSYLNKIVESWHVFPRQGVDLKKIGLGGINKLEYYKDCQSSASSTEIRNKN